jgi:hypothetical protein
MKDFIDVHELARQMPLADMRHARPLSAAIRGERHEPATRQPLLFR